MPAMSAHVKMAQHAWKLRDPVPSSLVNAHPASLENSARIVSFKKHFQNVTCFVTAVTAKIQRFEVLSQVVKLISRSSSSRPEVGPNLLPCLLQ